MRSISARKHFCLCFDSLAIPNNFSPFTYQYFQISFCLLHHFFKQIISRSSWTFYLCNDLLSLNRFHIFCTIFFQLPNKSQEETERRLRTNFNSWLTVNSGRVANCGTKQKTKKKSTIWNNAILFRFSLSWISGISLKYPLTVSRMRKSKNIFPL